MARGTKIALVFLLVLFVGTGVYLTLIAPSPNPTGDLSSGGLMADGGLDSQGLTGTTFPETIVLGPATPGGSGIEVISPPAGIDIFNQPAVDPAAAPNAPAPSLTGPGVTNGGGGPDGRAVTPAFVEPVAPVAPVAATTTYTVVSGDTLGGIAQKTYGRESAWTAILEANPGINPNSLKVGSSLQLPAGDQIAVASKSTRGAARGSTPPAKKGASKSTGTTGRRYTVKNGDTLWKIAKAEYGTATKANVDRIREANAIGADGSLKAGQSLTIPAK